MIEKEIEGILEPITKFTKIGYLYALDPSSCDLEPIQAWVDDVFSGPQTDWEYIALRILNEMHSVAKSNHVLIELFLNGFSQHIVNINFSVSSEIIEKLIQIAFQKNGETREARGTIYMFIDTVAPNNPVFLQYKSVILNPGIYLET